MYSLLRLAALTALCVSVAVGQEEVVLIPAGDQVRDTGANFLVGCKINGVTPTDQPSWYDENDNEILGIGSGGNANLYTQDDGADGSRLMFQPVMDIHAGLYTCRYGAAQTAFSLTITVPISFGNTEANQEAVIGVEELIECEVLGNPVPEISWKLPGNVDPPAAGYVQEDGGLRILNPTLQDEGEFVCHAVSLEAGDFQQFEINVNVLEPPTFTTLPTGVVGLEDREEEFNCKADGDPNPAITWSFGGNDLVDGEKYVYVNQGEQLRILNLTESDEGDYTCEASNQVSAITATASLEVYLKPEIGVETNVTVTQSQQATFTCQSVRGKPDPNLFWSNKEGNKYNLGDNDEGRIQVTEVDAKTLTLTINVVEVDDEGFFTCMADNEAGDDTRNFYLDVKYPPVVNTELTKVDVNSWIGNPTNLTCVIEGDPIPTVTWDRNGEAFNESFQYTLDVKGFSNSILFTAYEDAFGEYKCSGSNEIEGQLSSAEQVINLNRAVQPEMPTDLKVEDVYSTTVRLSLKKPANDGGEAITQYQVRATEENNVNEDDIIIQLIDAKELDDEGSILAKGLEPSMTYDIDVAAVNPVGPGPYSSSKPVTMNEARKPYSPTITSGKVADVDSYTLKWEHPVDNGGAIIKDYTIKYILVENEVYNDPKEKILPGISAERTDYPISNLEPNSMYKITLFATNLFGDGDEAKVEIGTKKAPLTPPPEDKTLPPPNPQPVSGALSTGAVVGIVIAVCILLLILIDISCYFMNDCGITHFLCFSLCGKSDSEKDGDVEMGGVKSKQEEAQEKPKESDPNATEEEQKTLIQGKPTSPEDVKIEPTDREDDNPTS